MCKIAYLKTDSELKVYLKSSNQYIGKIIFDYVDDYYVFIPRDDIELTWPAAIVNSIAKTVADLNGMGES